MKKILNSIPYLRILKYLYFIFLVPFVSIALIDNHITKYGNRYLGPDSLAKEQGFELFMYMIGLFFTTILFYWIFLVIVKLIKKTSFRIGLTLFIISFFSVIFFDTNMSSYKFDYIIGATYVICYVIFLISLILMNINYKDLYCKFKNIFRSTSENKEHIDYKANS